jgi:hypothetical protein
MFLKSVPNTLTLQKHYMVFSLAIFVIQWVVFMYFLALNVFHGNIANT